MSYREWENYDNWRLAGPPDPPHCKDCGEEEPECSCMPICPECGQREGAEEELENRISELLSRNLRLLQEVQQLKREKEKMVNA